MFIVKVRIIRGSGTLVHVAFLESCLYISKANECLNDRV